MSMDLEALGEVLRERREAIGISKAELARRVGISESYVSLVEQGDRRPSRGVLEHWVRALRGEAEPTDSYFGALLRLAGHENPEEDQGIPAVPLPFGGGTLYFPQPRRLERERLVREFQELLDKAAASGTEHWEGTVELTDSFIKGVGQVLLAPSLTPSRWRQLVQLFSSYLDWLAFRTGRKND